MHESLSISEIGHASSNGYEVVIPSEAEGSAVAFKTVGVSLDARFRILAKQGWEITNHRAPFSGHDFRSCHIRSSKWGGPQPLRDIRPVRDEPKIAHVENLGSRHSNNLPVLKGRSNPGTEKMLLKSEPKSKP
jgi:hypothetical protein